MLSSKEVIPITHGIYSIVISLLRYDTVKSVEVKIPAYQIIGEDVVLEKIVRIKIQSQYVLSLKVSSIFMHKT